MVSRYDYRFAFVILVILVGLFGLAMAWDVFSAENFVRVKKYKEEIQVVYRPVMDDTKFSLK